MIKSLVVIKQVFNKAEKLTILSNTMFTMIIPKKTRIISHEIDILSISLILYLTF